MPHTLTYGQIEFLPNMFITAREDRSELSRSLSNLFFHFENSCQILRQTMIIHFRVEFASGPIYEMLDV